MDREAAVDEGVLAVFAPAACDDVEALVNLREQQRDVVRVVCRSASMVMMTLPRA